MYVISILFQLYMYLISISILIASVFVFYFKELYDSRHSVAQDPDSDSKPSTKEIDFHKEKKVS